MTWGELYNLFRSRNVDMSTMVEDYRPADTNCMRLWLKDDSAWLARYIPERGIFIVTLEKKCTN